jgi:hypothetical protein
MENVTKFVAEAERFESWARDATDEGKSAVCEALLRITCLYLAALHLPPAWSDELSEDAEPERVSNDELSAIYSRCSRLPFDSPTIANDISEIYGDVVSGLRAYRSGHRAEAIWEWGFGFLFHWGRHATDTIGALHAWLAEHAFDR